VRWLCRLKKNEHYFIYKEGLSLVRWSERSIKRKKGAIRRTRGVQQQKDEMIAKSGQSKAPTLDIDGEILGDSDKDQVTQYLKEKGVEGF
jgi:hypothetical protein